jgi:hypothetical protein
MGIAKPLAACLGVVFLLTVTASSARADGMRAVEVLEKLDNFENHFLSLPDQSRAGIVHAFSEQFEGNNGKHLGFSVASTNRGQKFGLFKSPAVVGGSAVPNPEPAAVFLLGTGLAAVGAYARRRFRKSRH